MTNENKQNFESYIDYAYEKAIEAYKETDEYYAISQSVELSDKELRTKYSEEEYESIMTKVDAYIMQAEREGSFLYRKGFEDCVAILKEIGILNK